MQNTRKTDPVRPEDVLPDGVEHTVFDGVEVRKGSVAAFVANARRLEALNPGSPEHAAVADQLRSLVPALAAVGVLDVFVPRSPALAALVVGSREG